jgi:hypothetical protein
MPSHVLHPPRDDDRFYRAVGPLAACCLIKMQQRLVPLEAAARCGSETYPARKN